MGDSISSGFFALYESAFHFRFLLLLGCQDLIDRWVSYAFLRDQKESSRLFELYEPRALNGMPYCRFVEYIGI